MKNELIVVLPQEVEQLAQGVSIEKRNEVQTVLNHVFNGVSKMREQLDSVIVENENDKVNMKLANTIRLGVRQVRLDAEKEFDAKRSEVQQAMVSFKTEDSLWLKAKQTMQILTKEIEENARWKEETKERIEAERKELEVQQRILKVSKFNPELHRSEYEHMSSLMFDLFLSGIEKDYNDRIEAERKAEAERIEAARIEAERIENQRIENERLKVEADKREKEIEAERKKQEAILKAERAEQERLLNVERKKQADLEAELKAKKDAELLAEKQRQEVENAKQAEIERLKSSSDKEKLTQFADTLNYLKLPEVQSEKAKELVKAIELRLSVIIAEINSYENV